MVYLLRIVNTYHWKLLLYRLFPCRLDFYFKEPFSHIITPLEQDPQIPAQCHGAQTDPGPKEKVLLIFSTTQTTVKRQVRRIFQLTGQLLKRGRVQVPSSAEVNQQPTIAPKPAEKLFRCDMVIAISFCLQLGNLLRFFLKYG